MPVANSPFLTELPQPHSYPFERVTLSSTTQAELPLQPNLDEAYELCRQETARWAKTFYLGTLLLPLAKRRAIWAIYVWCRRTDELMDSPQAQGLPADELGWMLGKVRVARCIWGR